MTGSDSKHQMRQAALARRDALPAQTRQQAAAAIAERLFALPAWQAAGVVAVYAAFRSEVATGDIIARALAAGKRVAAPATRWGERALEFRVISRAADLVPGRLGIPEPGPECPALRLAEADLVLVPGAAFDRRGYRLGYGAGLYDRALAGAPALLAVGLAFAAQVVARVPAGASDRPVDLLVTERETIDCGAVRRQTGGG